MCHVIIGGPVGNKYICDVILAICEYRPSTNVVAEKRRVHHLKLSKLVQTVTLPTCTWEVRGSNLGWNNCLE